MPEPGASSSFGFKDEPQLGRFGSRHWPDQAFLCHSGRRDRKGQADKTMRLDDFDDLINVEDQRGGGGRGFPSSAARVGGSAAAPS
jgi:hypothetical protein